MRIDELDTRLTGSIEALDTRLSGRIDDFESRVSARFDDLESRVSARFDALEAKVDARINDVEAKLDAKIDSVDQRLTVQMEDIRDQIRFVAEVQSVHGATLDRVSANVEVLKSDVAGLKLGLHGLTTMVKRVVDNHERRLTALEGGAAG